MSLWKKLLKLGLDSSDPAVRGTSEAIVSESSFTKLVGWVEAPDSVAREEPEPDDDGKFYHDFHQDPGVMAESDLENE